MKVPSAVLMLPACKPIYVHSEDNDCIFRYKLGRIVYGRNKIAKMRYLS
jgi:hypothetical protein